MNRKDRGPWERQVGQAAGPCTGLGVGAVPGGSSDNQVPLHYYPTRELRRERSMELELRVRLSERPVPPGCGQREQLAQLHAAASLCFPVLPCVEGDGDLPDRVLEPSPQPSLILLTLLPTPIVTIGTGHLHVHLFGFPLFVSLVFSPKPGLGWRQEMLVDEETCCEEKLGRRFTGHVGLGPRASMVQCPDIHPPIPALALPHSC